VFALAARRLPAAWSGRAQLAGGLVVVAAGQLALSGITPGSSWARFLPGLVVAGVGSGVLNAALGREAVASVPPGRGGMGSGANNTARYLGSSIGVTLVAVVVAAHAVPGSGASGLVAGWNVAAWVTAGISLVGAGIVWATTVTDRRGPTQTPTPTPTPTRLADRLTFDPVEGSVLRACPSRPRSTTPRAC
jgi:hypothetical protein